MEESNPEDRINLQIGGKLERIFRSGCSVAFSKKSFYKNLSKGEALERVFILRNL